MSTLVSLWNQATERRFRSVVFGLGVVCVGVLLIAVGAIVEWSWTRIIGAGIISMASVFVGALVGWSDPVRPQIAALFLSWSRTLLTLLTLVMVAPLFAGLLVMIGGLFLGGGEGDWQSLTAGFIIALFLFIISLSTVALALSLAVQGLWKTSSHVPPDLKGQDES